jgi:hypothetical protein
LHEKVLAYVSGEIQGEKRMMPVNRLDERRRHPRIIHHLPVTVAADGYDFNTITQNISCVGAYCHLERYIPPFTKIMIRLTLPMLTIPLKQDNRVSCKGVIVRTEDAPMGGFNVAIYFNEIKENQRNKISRYINQFIPR